MKGKIVTRSKLHTSQRNQRGFSQKWWNISYQRKVETCGVWGKKGHFCLAEWEMTWCVRPSESHTLWDVVLVKKHNFWGHPEAEDFCDHTVAAEEWIVGPSSMNSVALWAWRNCFPVWTYNISQTSGFYVPAQSLTSVLIFLSGMDLVPQHGVTCSSILGAKRSIVSLSKLQEWGRSSWQTSGSAYCAETFPGVTDL